MELEIWLALGAGACAGAALARGFARRPPPGVDDALQRAVAQFGPLMDRSPDLAWVKDAQGRFVYVNEALARALRQPREAVLGRTDRDFSPPHMAERYQADDREVLRTGEPLRREESVVQEAGRVTWAETLKVPLFDAQGFVVGTAGVARDLASPRAPADGA